MPAGLRHSLPVSRKKWKPGACDRIGEACPCFSYSAAALRNTKENIRMAKARSRFVNFRVTDEEFEQLKVACGRTGDPSMSVFARKVILSAPNLTVGNIIDKLNDLDRRISILEIAA